MSNETENTEVEVETITCGKCERVWPTISEQGVVFDKVGQCYACFITEVVEERNERMKKSDYQIENCPGCTGGLAEQREKCMVCFGRGWRKAEGNDIIQLVR